MNSTIDAMPMILGRRVLLRVSRHVRPRLEARSARAAASSLTWVHRRLHRQQTLALQLFSGELAGATDGFCLLPDSPLGRLFIVAAELHLAEETFALHLLLQRLEGLLDIIVTDKNLHLCSSLIQRSIGPTAKAPGPLAHRHA